jgi:hypothetical protein
MKSTFEGLTCDVDFDLLVFRGRIRDGRKWEVAQSKSNDVTSWHVTIGEMFIGSKDELIDALNLLPELE